MSDLDNEEIEATKKLQEKSADEMFEELGYIKYIGDYDIYYKNEYEVVEYYLKDEIIFSVLSKTINLCMVNGITMQELQAINKKCKELEWLE